MEVCRQARDIIYRTSRSSRATYEGGSGYTEKHIIIGTVMAIISYGRLSPSPGFLLFLTPDRTAGQPAGRKRIRMKNRASQLDKVVTSLLRRWANFIFFRKEIGMGGGEKKNPPPSVLTAVRFRRIWRSGSKRLLLIDAGNVIRKGPLHFHSFDIETTM